MKPIRAQSPEMVRINQDLWGITSFEPRWYTLAELELGERVATELIWENELRGIFG